MLAYGCRYSFSRKGTVVSLISVENARLLLWKMGFELDRKMQLPNLESYIKVSYPMATFDLPKDKKYLSHAKSEKLLEMFRRFLL
jgi:hypothetical protein